MRNEDKQIRESLNSIRILQEQDTQDINGVQVTNHASEDSEIANDIENQIQKVLDEFKNQVSQVGDIQTVDLYDQNIEIKGSIVQHNMEFSYSLNDGVYISGTMIELNEDSIQVINNLHQFYNQFKASFGNLLY